MSDHQNHCAPSNSIMRKESGIPNISLAFDPFHVDIFKNWRNHFTKTPKRQKMNSSRINTRRNSKSESVTVELAVRMVRDHPFERIHTRDKSPLAKLHQTASGKPALDNVRRYSYPECMAVTLLTITRTLEILSLVINNEKHGIVVVIE